MPACCSPSWPTWRRRDARSFVLEAKKRPIQGNQDSLGCSTAETNWPISSSSSSSRSPTGSPIVHILLLELFLCGCGFHFSSTTAGGDLGWFEAMLFSLSAEGQRGQEVTALILPQGAAIQRRRHKSHNCKHLPESQNSAAANTLCFPGQLPQCKAGSCL